MATVFKTPYGTIEVLGFGRIEGGWCRNEEFTNATNGDKSPMRTWCLSRIDLTPVQSREHGHYDGERCAACYLGHSHTEALHVDNIQCHEKAYKAWLISRGGKA